MKNTHDSNRDELIFYTLLGALQCGTWLKTDIENFLEKFNISHGRYSILLALQHSSDGTVIGKDLAKLLGISKVTISKLIHKLVLDEYIEIKTGKKDQRKRNYSLTQKANELLAKINPSYLERLRVMVSSLSDNELKTLFSLLAKINFMAPGKTLIKMKEQTLSEKGKILRKLCEDGTAEDIDKVMAYLNKKTDIATTKIIDFYLGTVTTKEGIDRIKHYLFHGTQMQRNYCTLFFARKDNWTLVNSAYQKGLIDYKQAYSK